MAAWGGADVSIRIGTEFVGKKGLTQADKQLRAFTKNVQNLAGAFGIGLATTAIVRFGRESLSAFQADQKAANALAITMKNLGLQFSNPDVENYIASLSRAAGIADDQLRPAMQALLQVTGSVANSQKILAQAVDVSRASNIDLLTVSRDLAQAYVGNLKGLRKYNLGLTQAELKASSFADIQARLNGLFAGSSTAYLETYAGQMERLSVASKEAKETIGKGLVDAFAALGGGGSKGIDKVISSMEYLADLTGRLFKGIGGQVGAVGKLLTGDVKGAAALIASSTNPAAYKGAIPSISGMVKASEQKKAEAAAVKRQKELVTLQKQQVSATKAITQAKKASAIFDMDQIQIVAALKGRISEEEKIRLQLQSAILMGNNAEAARLTVELSKTVGMSQELSTWLRNLPNAKNPFEAWQSYLDGILGQIAKIAQAPAAIGSTHIGGTGLADWGAASYEAITNPYGTGSYYGATGRDMPSNLNITVTGGDAVTQALSFNLQSNSLSGSFAQINRADSSFV